MGRPLDEDYTSDGLIRFMKEQFGYVQDGRSEKDIEISLGDALQSAYSMFALKSPSLLSYIEEMAVHGHSVFLFGAVLSSYLARHVGVNHFVETVLRTVGKGERMRWRPQCGTRPIL